MSGELSCRCLASSSSRSRCRDARAGQLDASARPASSVPIGTQCAAVAGGLHHATTAATASSIRARSATTATSSTATAARATARSTRRAATASLDRRRGLRRRQHRQRRRLRSRLQVARGRAATADHATSARRATTATAVSGDGCSADCKSTETCGNGIVDTVGEVCDDGNTSAAMAATPTAGRHGLRQRRDRSRRRNARSATTATATTPTTACRAASSQRCGDGMRQLHRHARSSSAIRPRRPRPCETTSCNIDCTTAAAATARSTSTLRASSATTAPSNADDARLHGGLHRSTCAATASTDTDGPEHRAVRRRQRRADATAARTSAPTRAAATASSIQGEQCDLGAQQQRHGACLLDVPASRRAATARSRPASSSATAHRSTATAARRLPPRDVRQRHHRSGREVRRRQHHRATTAARRPAARVLRRRHAEQRHRGLRRHRCSDPARATSTARRRRAATATSDRLRADERARSRAVRTRDGPAARPCQHEHCGNGIDRPGRAVRRRCRTAASTAQPSCHLGSAATASRPDRAVRRRQHVGNDDCLSATRTGELQARDVRRSDVDRTARTATTARRTTLQRRHVLGDLPRRKCGNGVSSRRGVRRRQRQQRRRQAVQRELQAQRVRRQRQAPGCRAVRRRGRRSPRLRQRLHPPVCGDGHKNTAAGESCDDGNSDGTSAIRAARPASPRDCGNGVVDNGEQCDPNTGVPATDAASCDDDARRRTAATATSTPSAESCDDGAANGTPCGYNDQSCTLCNSTCTARSSPGRPFCGDGVTQGAFGETCDLGVTTACRPARTARRA